MKKITTALELVGVAAIITGVALVWVPAAFIVGGLGLFALSWALTRPTGRTTS